MNAALEGLLLGTLRGLIRAYPPPFRARFGGELLQVYSVYILEAGRAAGARGLAWLWLSMLFDGAFSVLAQWGSHWLRQITKGRLAMSTPIPVVLKNEIAPLPPGQAALAALPFVLFGAANLVQRLNLVVYNAGHAPLGLMLVTHPYLVYNWLILIGLAVGAFYGLPRWSYTYLGWAVLNALWLANLSFYGQVMNFMCFPLFLALAIPLLIRWRRAQQPGAQPALTTPWRDLTLLPLAVYIFWTAVYMLYDENHHPALLWFIAASGLAGGLGAWGYFRAAAPLPRALSLVGGLALVIALEIWNSLTWDAGAYYGFPDYSPISGIQTGLTFFAIIAAGMLAVGGLAELIRRRKPV